MINGEYQEAKDYLFKKYAEGANEDGMLLRHYLDLIQELINKHEAVYTVLEWLDDNGMIGREEAYLIRKEFEK